MIAYCPFTITYSQHRFITFASHLKKAGETNILAYKAKISILLWYNDDKTNDYR